VTFIDLSDLADRILSCLHNEWMPVEPIPIAQAVITLHIQLMKVVGASGVLFDHSLQF